MVLAGPLLAPCKIHVDSVTENLAEWRRLAGAVAHNLGCQDLQEEGDRQRVLQYYLPVFYWVRQQVADSKSSGKKGPCVVCSPPAVAYVKYGHDEVAAPEQPVPRWTSNPKKKPPGWQQVGISAPQGCGKTTLVGELEKLLTAEGLTAAAVSIDDFYLRRSQLLELAEELPTNSLLQGRGNAGTHDLPLGTQTLAKLQAGTCVPAGRLWGHRMPLPATPCQPLAGTFLRPPPHNSPTQVLRHAPHSPKLFGPHVRHRSHPSHGRAGRRGHSAPRWVVTWPPALPSRLSAVAARGHRPCGGAAHACLSRHAAFKACKRGVCGRVRPQSHKRLTSVRASSAAGSTASKGIRTRRRSRRTVACREVVKLPRYNKSAYSGAGDRAHPAAWPEVKPPVDVVLFEGWMLGFRPVGDAAAAAVHAGLCEVNARLRAYRKAWDTYVDAWVVIEVAEAQWVFTWRMQAERQMRAEGKAGMTDEEVAQFVRRYMPAYEAYLPQLYAEGPTTARPGRTLFVRVGEARQLLGGRVLQGMPGASATALAAGIAVAVACMALTLLLSAGQRRSKAR